MDIIKLRGQPHLSSSGISDYLDCGLLFKFIRIDKIKVEGTSDALELGSCIHKTLAEFYQERMIGHKLPIEDLKGIFETYWKRLEGRDDIDYEEGENFETILQKGKDLLDMYYANLPDDDFKVLAIEEPFSFSIPGLPIPMLGYIDLIEEDSSGTLIVSDWKTTSRAYSSDRIDKSLQLTIYQMAAKANGYRDKDILLRFDCLIKTKIPKFEQYYTTRSEEDERRAVKKILKIWEGISKGIFIPNDGNWKCNGCGYKEYCDKWFLEG